VVQLGSRTARRGSDSRGAAAAFCPALAVHRSCVRHSQDSSIARALPRLDCVALPHAGVLTVVRIRGMHVAAVHPVLCCLHNRYGSLCGIPELREAIATHYNRLYRRGKKQYTADNVAVAGGGRGVLARLFAALQGRVGYRVPDYTAYTDLFNYSCDRVTPVYMPTLAENGFHVLPEDLRREAEGKGDSGRKLDAMFMSNPCNPTGEIVQGRQLQE